MSSFLSPFANSGQPGHRSYSGQSLQGLDVEMGGVTLHDYDTADGPATATQGDTDMEGGSLHGPSPTQHVTRPFPTSVKRKRYSVSLEYPADDDTLKLSKVRNGRNSPSTQVVPPEVGQHLGDDFPALPPALQAALLSSLSAKATAQRKATDRVVRETCVRKPEDEPQFDVIGKISQSVDVLVCVAKFLRPDDIVNLYSISRDFHATLDGNLQSSIVKVASHICPLAAQVFPHHFYTACSVPDPAGRPRDPAYHNLYARLASSASLPSAQLPGPGPGPGSAAARRIPSLVWLRMVHARHVRVRDILASLARQGHRLPRGTHATLLKLWLVLDLPTNADRATLVATRRFLTRFDLYRASLFLVKLCLRANDPLYGPDHMQLPRLMLGQRGLTPLWRLLRGKAYTTYLELLQLKMRYDVAPTPSQLRLGRPICGVPVREMGRTHLEGFGAGGPPDEQPRQRLLRLDELVVRECARRGLDIEPHLEGMMVYGHVDVARGVDLAPALEELYMSDPELPDEVPADERDPHDVVAAGGCGNVPFADDEWTPKLARKAAWEALTDRQRVLIAEDDRDEMLRSLAWEIDSQDTLQEEEEDGDEEEEEAEEEREGGGREENEGSDKENILLPEERRPAIPRVVIQDFELDNASVASSTTDPDGSLAEGSGGSLSRPPPSPKYQNRIVSTDSLMLPQLQNSSRVTSMASEAIVTPQMGPSGGFRVHVQDADYPMSEISDLDLDQDESTVLAPSSFNVTPVKGMPPSHPPESDGEYDGDEEGGESDGEEDGDESEEDDEEEEEDEEEDDADHDDEELRAQAYEHYSESEFEIDWDGFMEEYQWEKEAQAEYDEREGDTALRQYRRRY